MTRPASQAHPAQRPPQFSGRTARTRAGGPAANLIIESRFLARARSFSDMSNIQRMETVIKNMWYFPDASILRGYENCLILFHCYAFVDWAREYSNEDLILCELLSRESLDLVR